MKLSTPYLGLTLRNPLVVGASPFGDNLQVARQLQDAGAGALVMRSLFEEQLEAEQFALTHFMEVSAESSPEATSYFPRYEEYQLASDQYLRQLAGLKQALTIPVIASLNGYRPGGWTDYAQKFESAGADAIELNLYQLVTDPAINADDVEERMLDTVHTVTSSVKIPVAVKLSSFHTAPARFALDLEQAGAAGVVLFNRFYQPDFDIEAMEVQPHLKLSDPTELLMRLRWLAIISPHLRGSLAASGGSLAASGGAHTAVDVIKALLAGAHTVQMVSVLLKHGVGYLAIVLSDLKAWMTDHGYKSVDEFRGAMNLKRCPDPAAFERANYQRILQSWRI